MAASICNNNDCRIRADLRLAFPIAKQMGLCDWK